VQSIIYFTGAQTGNAIVGVTLPGYYIIHNKCTGTSYVQLAPAAASAITAGNRIGAPPGKKCHVFFDGTDMDYVNMPDPGTAYDFHTNTTSLPPWMLACSSSPYLIKDGSIYSTATYPALAQYLGSTYGGNGITTFGVPDERARFRAAIDTGSTGRLSGSGVTGTTFGSAGGASTNTLVTGNLPPYTPAGSVGVTGTIPGSNSAGSLSNQFAYGNGSVSNFTFSGSGTLSGTAQGGTSTPISNVPPVVMSILALIKT